MHNRNPSKRPMLIPDFATSRGDLQFDLVVNQKTAMVIGLAIPDKIIALADEVIE